MTKLMKMKKLKKMIKWVKMMKLMLLMTVIFIKMNWFVNEEYKLKLNSVVLPMVMCGYVWEVGDNLNYDISIVCKFGLMLVTQCTKITKRKLIT